MEDWARVAGMDEQMSIGDRFRSTGISEESRDSGKVHSVAMKTILSKVKRGTCKVELKHESNRVSANAC